MTINERIEAAIEARAAEIDWKLSSAARYMDAEHVEASRARSDTFRVAARIARETSPWVAVADGLPPPYTEVIVWWGKAPVPCQGVAWVDRDGLWWESGTGDREEATYWADFPEPPR